MKEKVSSEYQTDWWNPYPQQYNFKKKKKIGEQTE